MAMLLIVGAADTGRAPMAAALLRRIVNNRGDWQIGSAGVLGHDDDPPEAEARTAMVHLGLNIDDHRARSVSAELIEAAALVIAIDSGTAKALVARFPTTARVYSLGELAGSSRDIPDPFRMQVGAWMTYARELETLLIAAVAPIAAIVEPGDSGQQPDTKQLKSDLPGQNANLGRLLDLLVTMPGVLDWAVAKQCIEAELTLALAAFGPDDLAHAYAGLLRAALMLSANPPTAQQALALQAAFLRLEQPIQPTDLTALSLQIGGWQHGSTADYRR